jgi:phospholipase D1/2
VMIGVDHSAARALADIARARWHKATGHRLKPVSTPGDPWPPDQRVDIADSRVAVSCTQPPANGHAAVQHVEALYLDMIASARRYVYIENQYFTSEKVGAALEKRLGDPDGPEIVLVTRLLSHGWLEEMTMHVLRTRLVRSLRAADRHGKFHAYFPHVEGLCEGTCLDLHSKVMIVDDEWLRIGSSNLSNRSMGVDTECDVTVEAGGAARVKQSIRAMRDRLLAEHCGVGMPQLRAALESSSSIAQAVDKVNTPERCLRVLEAPEVSEALMAAAAVGDMEKPISLDALMADFTLDDPVPAKEVPSQVPYLLLGVIATFVALALAWRYTPLAGVVTPERVLGVIETFSRHWWAPLMLMAAYTPASGV